MQLAGDTVLAAAVDSPARTPVWDVHADWRRNGTTTGLGDLGPVLQSMTVERALTGDLPAEAGLVEGFGSASLSATLAGTAPAWARGALVELSPFRTDTTLAGAPLEGAPITAAMGLLTPGGPSLVPQFSGTVRSLTPRSSTRSVQVECLDRSETLRAPITLPVWGLYRTTSQLPADAGRWRTNTQCLLDYVLRRNNIWASPRPMPSTIWAAGLHGGLVPDVGFGGGTFTGGGIGAVPTSYTGPIWVPGPWGLLAPASPAGISLATGVAWQGIRGQDATPPVPAVGLVTGQGLGISARVDLAQALTGSAAAIRGVVNIVTANTVAGQRGWSLGYTRAAGATTARVWARVLSNNGVGDLPVGGPTIPITGGAQYLAAHIQVTSENSATVTFRAGGATSTVQITNATVSSSDTTPLFRAVPNLDAVTAQVTLAGTSITDASAWVTTTAPTTWTGETHTPEADLNPGLGELTALPAVEAAESLTVLRDIVAAEYGAFFFTETGRPTFWNRQTIATRMSGAPTRTVTAARSLIDLSAVRTTDSVRNTITARVMERALDLRLVEVAKGDTKEQTLTPANGTLELTLPLGPGVYDIASMDGPLANAGWSAIQPSPLYGRGSICTATRADGTTTEPDQSKITTLLMRRTLRTVTLRITNTNTYPIWLALPDGTPALSIAGHPAVDLTERTSTATDTTSAGLYGPRTLDIGSGPWRQYLPSLAGVVAPMLTELARPSAVLEDIPMVGDPRTQLGDVLTLADPDGLGTVTGGVVKVSLAVDGTNGLRNTVAVRVRT